MYNDIEELKSELLRFQDNISRTNGIIDSVGEAIDKLNRNYEALNEANKLILNTMDSFASFETSIDEEHEKLSNIIRDCYVSINDSVSELKKSTVVIKRTIEDNNNENIEKTNNINNKLDSFNISLSKLQKELHSVKQFVLVGIVLSSIALILQFI